MRKGLGASGLTIGMLWATGALGQTLQPAEPADGPPDASAVEEVVVTGSRLSQTLVQSPVPVVAVTAEQLEQTGTDNLADVLTELPAVGVGLTDTNTQNFYALAALNLVDLRNLGYNRTLVLVNGRRQVAGDVFTSAVDLNSIPTPLIDRVEVVTGGTSAVYGADAVSGVVNIILKDDFEGLEARVRGGVSARGDGESFGLSLTGGTNFAEDRGNVFLNLYYDTVEGVKATKRKWSSNGLATILNPAYTGDPSQPIVLTRRDVRYFGPNQIGFLNFGPLGVFSLTNNGTAIRPYDFGEVGNVGGEGILIGGDGGYFQPYDNLSQPIERFGVSGGLKYELAPNVRLFAEARVLTTHTETRWQPVADFEYGPVLIASDNIYVPANLRPALAAAGAPGFPFERVYEDFGRRGADNDRTMQQYTAGLEGRLADRFDYQVFAGYGRTNLDNHLVDGRDQDRFLESTDVVLVNGQPACRSAEARARGCQPLNVFNPASTPAGIAYSRTDDTYNARNTLKMAGASLTGPLFTLPAGPVDAAVGVEARETSAETNPSAAARRGRIQLLFEEPLKGTIKVKEAFGELRAPLIADRKGVEELTLQAAGRLSDYNTNGSHTSWNAGGVYSPVDGLRFRVMRSRSVRAPNVDELFSPGSQTFLNVTDPCTTANLALGSPNRAENCRALGVPANFAASTGSKPVYVGGNADLDVETADTLTVGLTLAPDVLPGFTATVDWYDIEITDAIGAIDYQVIVNNCVDLDVPPSGNPLCQSVTRDPATRQITGVYATNLNIGELRTRGVDVTLDYAFPLEQLRDDLPGRLRLTLTGTYLDKLRQLTDANDPDSENALEGYRGRPEWELLGTATYDLDRLSVTWRTRYIDSTSVLVSENLANPLPDNLFDKPETGSEVFHDVSVAYDLTEKANLRLNVNNIFDNKPPARGFGITSGLREASIYPNLGTLFSAALTYKF